MILSNLRIEWARDGAMMGLLVGGAVLQSLLSGPWLLLIGSIALGVRISFVTDGRYGFASTLAGGLLWYALHWFVVSGLSQAAVASEVLTFSCLMVIFSIARLHTCERVTEGKERLAKMQEESLKYTERLKRLETESEGMIQESEDWTKLFGVTRSIGEVLRAEDIMDVIREAVETHLKLPVYALLLVKNGTIRVGAQKGFDDQAMAEAAFSTGAASVASWLLNQREPVLVDNLAADRRFSGTMFPYRSLVALPMWVREEPLGLLLAFDVQSRNFGHQDFQRASILAKQLALGISNTSLYARIEELSITDGLTKLNRVRHFLERFDGELDRARRYSHPLSLLMGDLDSFKHLNDTYGHLEGDEMLKLTARVMEQNFKRPAILARYGGEEFSILLPDVTKEAAVEQADRFREALSVAKPDSTENRSALTISIGVASFPADAQTRRNMIARADLALYKAKREGKNRVCPYDDSIQDFAAGGEKA